MVRSGLKKQNIIIFSSCLAFIPKNLDHNEDATYRGSNKKERTFLFGFAIVHFKITFKQWSVKKTEKLKLEKSTSFIFE
jgi:hypothetical protein